LAVSSNTYFAQLGSILGARGLLDAAGRFELGRKPVIGPAGVFDNSFPCKGGTVPELRQVSASSVAGLAIGQDRLLVTPLQMAMVMATIADEGILRPPTFLKGYSSEGKRVMGQKTALRIGLMLREAVSEGTGRNAEIQGAEVCGKTGTAERDTGSPHAWFIGYAPADEAVVALAVVIEGGGYGGVVSAPIARQLFRIALTDKADNG